MLELLANLGAGLFSHTVESGTNYVTSNALDSASQNRSFNYNQKSAKAQQIRELQNLQNAPSAYVQGLKRAGINPALLASGQVPVGQSTALPVSGSAHMSPGTSGSLQAASAAVLSKKQAELTDSEIELNESTAAKNYAEAGVYPSQTKKNDADALYAAALTKRIQDADEASAEFLSKSFGDLAASASSQRDRDFYESLARRAPGMSLGSLQGMMQVTDWLRGLSEYDRDLVLNLVHKKVAQLQLGSHEDLRSLADMPFADFKRTMAQVGDLVASRKLRDTERNQIDELLEHRKELLVSQTLDTDASRELKGSQDALNKQQLALRPKEIEMEKHKNFVQMIDEGEYGNAALYLLEGIVQFVVGMYAARAAFKGKAPTQNEIQNQLNEYQYKTEEWTTKQGHKVTKTTKTKAK